MLIHGLQPVGYRSHALRIGTVATVSIRGYFSAMNEIQDGLSALTEGRRRASSAGWRHPSESVHRRRAEGALLARCAAGQRTQEPQQGGVLLVEAAGKAVEQ